MKAAIVSFRRGRHHQNTKQNILKVADTAEEAQKYIGRTVSWTSPGKNPKIIRGKISALHGRKGNVRVLFTEKGLPGQALGTLADIEEQTV